MINAVDLERYFIVRIKIAGVTRTTALGNEAGLHLLLIDLNPIDGLEPAMFLDVHATFPEIAVSPRQIHL